MSILWRVRNIAPGGGISVYPASVARNAGHGNDIVWKAWEPMKPASHPSHSLLKSLRDSHIPTASTTGYMAIDCCMSSRIPRLTIPLRWDDQVQP